MVLYNNFSLASFTGHDLAILTNNYDKDSTMEEEGIRYVAVSGGSNPTGLSSNTTDNISRPFRYY